MKLGSRKIAGLALAAIILAVIGYRVIAPNGPSVTILVAKTAPADRVLAVNGRIRPRLQVDVTPSIGGRLIALPFDVGDRVTSGQIIARIDDAPELAAITVAEQSFAAQQATVAQARRELARFVALGQFATKREVENLRLAVAEGARELGRRQATIVQARELRDRRVLRAPFSGEILERPVDPGQTVGPDTIIYRLADLSSPEVSIEVDEIYAAEIRPGMAATVSMPGQPQPLQANVRSIESRVDPATGARDVRLSLAQPALDVPSGLTVTVNLLIERRPAAISIPRSAVITSGSSAKVRIVGKDNQVADRTIQFIDWPADSVIVLGGIAPGDRILIEPDEAKPGDTVRVSG